MAIDGAHSARRLHPPTTIPLPETIGLISRFASWARSSFRSLPSRLAVSAGLLAAGALVVLVPAHTAHARAAAAGDIPTSVVHQPVEPKYELRLHHLHTGESLDVVYRVGDTYI